MAAASSTPSKMKAEKGQMESQKAQPKSTKLSPIKIYLITYNTLSALAWGYLLFLTVFFMLTPRSASASAPTSFLSKLLSPFAHHSKVDQIVDHLKGSYDFKGLGCWTKWVQSVAVLEVVHAGLGWVRSPVGTVASQVASRLWTVWGVVEAAPEMTHNSPLFTTMLLAWSLAEVIRYTFYTTTLLNIASPTLNYLRYTTFFALYPLGAGSEAFLSFATLPPLTPLVGKMIGALPRTLREVVVKSKVGRELLWWVAKGSVNPSKAEWGLMECLRAALFIIWWPALYVLFTYMLKQRKKVLGKGKTVGGINKAR